jgi:hypothetical protein
MYLLSPPASYLEDGGGGYLMRLVTIYQTTWCHTEDDKSSPLSTSCAAKIIQTFYQCITLTPKLHKERKYKVSDVGDVPKHM